ncbi:hypothetical protein TREMEDRAFT_59859 [Tremella mesenterica DSM 1558]|uniref:uncharacterized protein n=1 Tax=Tremella mesenterica (strain ATCC 24925 / CBS 8224 / DSM 1558 / NBRC 9311 / NRRL Y-6157 / RJB 2259-6 / UBC 559-6) TaxID=578456 RepID=UPI0003F4A179|nr:uncharacterized protein TREMEDRAFT_59859 [Tremella mesenterica DSM 1558]EIW73686.1 hypothetical protein TREMEDRAFT_59859 [Tremella mesenterica DSM 1558]
MHRLVKIYLFTEWKKAVRFMRRIEELVEEHDHHPSILICPASDHPSKKWSQAKGYIVEVSTHTHTPLSYIEPGTPKKATEDKPLPGITGKDLGFAQELEEVHRELSRMV